MTTQPQDLTPERQNQAESPGQRNNAETADLKEEIGLCMYPAN